MRNRILLFVQLLFTPMQCLTSLTKLQILKFAHTNSLMDWPQAWVKALQNQFINKQGDLNHQCGLLSPPFLSMPSLLKPPTYLETSLLSFQSFCSVTAHIQRSAYCYGPLNPSPEKPAHHHPCKEHCLEIKFSFCSTAKDRNCFSKNWHIPFQSLPLSRNLALVLVLLALQPAPL